MKMKLFALGAIVGISCVLTGCVGTVEGGSRAGVPLLHDNVSGRYERTLPQVFDAARAVLDAQGKTTANNTINHSLVGQVNQRSVFIKVDELDPVKPLTQITVQVRTKAGGADISLAHELEKEVALKLVNVR